MKKLALVLVLLLAGCDEKKDEGWLGYGEGDSAMISAPQAGWVTALTVERGKEVKRGDLLFVLDNVQQEASQEQAVATLEQMRASLKQEQANLVYTRTELARQDSLARAGAGVPAQRDLARNNERQSEARISQLQAQIDQMERIERRGLWPVAAAHHRQHRRSGAGHLFPARRICAGFDPGGLGAAAGQYLCSFLCARE